MMLLSDPEYLDRPSCPYDAPTKKDLKALVKTETVEKIVEKIVEREKIIEKAAEGGGKSGPKPRAAIITIDSIEAEIKDITDELKQLKMDGASLDTNDKVQIIKTRAALVEKLVGYRERTTNVKRMSLFQTTVMTILDDLVDDDKRQEFLRRLEPFRR